MIRVHVLVEGQTEITFVKTVLQPHFAPYETFLFPRKLGKPQHKRGICAYPRAQREILATLKQEPHTFCTTMFDYYRMPFNWPKREEARCKPFAQKSATVENAILADISAQLGVGSSFPRFIPYIQMHEFEALLFSDPGMLAQELDLSDDSEVQRILNQFDSPEEINDSEQTAPSKRILRLYAQYDKVDNGATISKKIGLDVMRAQCPHFNKWIEKLEALASR